LAFLDTIKRYYPYLLLGVYCLFSCGYFFMEHYSDHYRMFARLVFPLSLFVVFAPLKALWRDALFKLILVYMAYLLLSGLWSEPLDWYALGQKATNSLYILCFLALTYYLRHANPVLFERGLQACIIVATLAAVVSIAAYYSNHSFPEERLAGIGSLTNINEFSAVYGVYAVLALSFVLDKKSPILHPIFLTACLIFLAFAWLGQSRTTFVALVIALGFLSACKAQQRKAWLWSVMAVAATVAGMLILFPGSIEQAIERGAGLRPGIWSAVWEQARTSPFFGHGLVSPLSVESGGLPFGNAHSAYLQVFWQGGVVGLALFVSLMALALRTAMSQGRATGHYLTLGMLVFAALVMLTDLDTLIGRPREQWLLFWFPLALLLSQSTATSRAQ